MSLTAETKNKIIELLKENNLSETVSIFLKEVNSVNKGGEVKRDVYTNYIETYTSLLGLVEMSLDKYKAEFSNLLYPLFVQAFIELLYDQRYDEAQEFVQTFARHHMQLHGQDVHELLALKRKEHADNSNLVAWFRFHKYNVRMARETWAYVRYHLTKNGLHDVLNKLETSIDIEISDEPPRTAEQVERAIGSIEGEIKSQINKTKIYCGLLKESDVVVSLGTGPGADNEEEVVANGVGDSKKKKSKKESFLLKKSKIDPLAPPNNRIPLPEMKESDKIIKILMAQESLKRFKITPHTLPTVCCYTVLNANNGVTCAEISDDSSLLAVGFQDSIIKMYSLTPDKLKSMKSAVELEKLDKTDDDVLRKVMDEKSASDFKVLTGHTDPITALSISHDKLYLISSSQDATIRLWSLLTYKDIVCYKGHMLPVWDVAFSPFGYYFASCGADRTLRLWTTDQHQPLRICVGHLSDVDVLCFHPNSNYLATGSSDRTVRMWDILTGKCVRIFAGHKTPITALTFAPNGRQLVSGSKDGTIIVWDLVQGHFLTYLRHHTDAVYAIEFDRDGVAIASGSRRATRGADCSLAFWDYRKLSESNEASSLYVPPFAQDTTTDAVLPKTDHSTSNDTRNAGKDSENERSNNYDLRQGPYLMRSFRTKNSPLIQLHFTWRNLMLTITEYSPPA